MSRRHPDEPAPAAAARLLREARKGALATLEPAGSPYASLVTVATEPDGVPLLLLSRLALHTRNLDGDDRASLLIDASGPESDPLAGGRVTLSGRCRPTSSPTARRRFVARHPDAAVYAGFADFRFFSLAIERAHFIGGFGRIVDLDPTVFVASTPSADALVEGEAELIEALLREQPQLAAALAEGDGAATEPAWRLSGVDPTGLDLMSTTGAARRWFGKSASSPDAARAEIAELLRGSS